jgi:hemoglobin/transferrin/lactoferrin receptor protein
MRTRTLFAALFAVGVAARVFSRAETITLPDLVVTPMRSSTEAASVPASTYVVSSDAIFESAPRTSPEALKGIPSVMVQKTSYGQGSPFLRGFTGFRTLLLVDGVRLNNSVFRDGPNQYWNTVDPFSIERYEVVLGPASVLYGSDAIGGAVNALSPAAPAWEGAPVWTRTLKYRGATADQSHQARIESAARIAEPLGVRAGYSWKSFDDVRGGADVGRQPFTGYDERAWDAGAEYAWRNGATLSLGHQQLNQYDAWRTHRTIYGIEWKNLTRGDDLVHRFDQDRTLTWLRLAHRERGSALDAYTLTLSRHKQGEDLERIRANALQEFQGFDVETWGVALALESVHAFGRLVYGADAYRDLVNSYGLRIAPGSDAKRATQGPVADDATYDMLGVFIQNTAQAGSIEVTPGLRYTRAQLDAEKVDKRPDGISGDWDAIVGSLRALLPLDAERQQTAYAGVSQGFRAPNLSDLTRLDIARSNEIETPVDDLDPEKFVTAEIGWRRETQKGYARAAYYYTWIDDMIVRAPTGAIVDDLVEVTKRNAGAGYVQGVEITTSVFLNDSWQTRAMGTWMEGEVDAYPSSAPERVRDNLSRVMPLTGRFALRWQPAGRRYWVEGIVDAADKADRLSAADRRDTQRIPPGGTPGYVVGTLRGGFRANDALAFTLAFENVANADYRIHGSGVNEPGRQLVFNAELTF